MVNYGDANYLSMLINNLLGNALQYADHDISVRVEKAEKGDAEIRLVIRNDGPGIPHNKRAELSKPFMRGDGKTWLRHGPSHRLKNSPVTRC